MEPTEATHSGMVLNKRVILVTFIASMQGDSDTFYSMSDSSKSSMVIK